MKRSLLLATLLIVASAVVVSVSAGGKGAVKVPFDPNVGWAIVNTNDSNGLKVTAHLESGLPNEAFGVTLRVRYEDGTVVSHTDIATLYTNGQGAGNIEVTVNLDPQPNSGTVRRVAVRLRRPGPPNIVYVALAWDVPLKAKTQFSQ
jgi:hypothetical protein